MQYSVATDTSRQESCYKRPVTLRCGLHWLFAIAFGLCLAQITMSAQAHELRPAIMQIKPDQKQQFLVTFNINLEGLIAGIGAEHVDSDVSTNSEFYNQLRKMSPAQLSDRFSDFNPRFLTGFELRNQHGKKLALNFTSASVPDVGHVSDSRNSVLTFNTVTDPDDVSISVVWDGSFGDLIVRANSRDGDEIYTGYLTKGQPSEKIPVIETETQPTLAIVKNFVVIGFSHIMPNGLDHILFIIGLFLLSTNWHSLLVQVTLFTLAHSLTLTFGIVGIIRLPSSIVEPLIAASIVYICLENIRNTNRKFHQGVAVFLFGLLHGLGFAGVLADAGINKDSFVAALVAFNVGIEVGQLTIIAACFLFVGMWFQYKTWYRSMLTVPASFIIGIIGVYWFISRVSQ